MKVERCESVPMPKMLAQVSFIMMFIKGLDWNYTMLMPSANPCPQCLITHSDGIHCFLAFFTLWGEQACWDDTLFSTGPFHHPPFPKAGWESDGDSSYTFLLSKMPEVFPKGQLCLYETWDAHLLEQPGFQVCFILLHGTAPHRTESHRSFVGRLSLLSFRARAWLSPS